MFTTGVPVRDYLEEVRIEVETQPKDPLGWVVWIIRLLTLMGSKGSIFPKFSYSLSVNGTGVV